MKDLALRPRRCGGHEDRGAGLRHVGWMQQLHGSGSHECACGQTCCKKQIVARLTQTIPYIEVVRGFEKATFHPCRVAVDSWQ